MNEVVKYHNDLSNQITIKTLNANEYNIFMAICSKMREKGTDEAIFTFQELKELTQWKNNNNELFVKNLVNTNKKLISLHFTFKYDKKIVQFVLFPTFTTDEKNKTLTVAVNKDFVFLLNNLSSNFTRFELEHFTSLQSKYSKYLYKELMKFKSTGYVVFKIDEFKEKLDIPEKYEMRDINKRVLTPAKEELSKIFKRLEIKKIKKGREITHIEFCFKLKQEVLEDIEIIDKPMEKTKDELQAFFEKNFPKCSYTKKHKRVLEKLKKGNSITYIENYLMRVWDYVTQNKEIQNKEAYFSQMILKEQDILKDYTPKEYQEKKKKIQENRLFELSEPKNEIKRIKAEDLVQENLFDSIEKDKEKIEISMEEYQNRYLEYLGKNKDTETQRNIFSMLMKKDGYVLKEKKIYSIEDIPEEKLLGKNGKKLVGGALKMRIKKCLDEMNEEIKG